MGHSPKRKAQAKGIQPKVGYAAESPFPCWPRGFLTSAHINKLMIIAKRENHTSKTYNKQKGKLEQKMVYHTVTYNFIVQYV